ncbi:hypothetical protein SVIOM342S_00748 [Streptomyces violaceorubidus]
MGLPGTSVLAAAATYAGVQVRGSLSELRARMLPREGAGVIAQAAALDAAAVPLVSRILDAEGRAEVAEETLEAAERIMRRLAEAPPVSGVPAQDLRDDQLLGHDEAAALILGLQDRTTRDRAAAWMEGDAAAPAMRLWRALARRCPSARTANTRPRPSPSRGWVAWSTGDELEAREALAMALGAKIPDYLFRPAPAPGVQRRASTPPPRGRSSRCLREGGEGGLEAAGDAAARTGPTHTARGPVRGARPGPGGLTRRRQPEPHCFARPAARTPSPGRVRPTGPRARANGGSCVPAPLPGARPPPGAARGRGPEAPAHLGDPTGHGAGATPAGRGRVRTGQGYRRSTGPRRREGERVP